MRSLKTIRIVCCICIVILFGIFPRQTEAESEKTVGINPLTIHASQDVSYLQAGIRSMIASRLAADAGVKVLYIEFKLWDPSIMTSSASVAILRPRGLKTPTVPCQ